MAGLGSSIIAVSAGCFMAAVAVFSLNLGPASGTVASPSFFLMLAACEAAAPGTSLPAEVKRLIWSAGCLALFVGWLEGGGGREGR